jgi:nucleoside 2-deoxyribosyltransferase
MPTATPSPGLADISKDQLYYLASPYSHENAEIREERYRLVNEYAAFLARNGISVIEPIVMGHPKVGLGVGTSFEYWKKTDELYISRCDGVIVLMLDGWEKSIGVNAEIAYAMKLGKPVFYVTAEDE